MPRRVTTSTVPAGLSASPAATAHASADSPMPATARAPGATPTEAATPGVGSEAATGRPALLPIGPVDQLRAGRLPRRLTQLFVGLSLYGASMAMMIRGALGLDPWDVFHYGVSRHVPWSFGTIVVVASFVVLLLWIPLRQMPGLGTIANSFWIGISCDLTLAALHEPAGLLSRAALLVGGVVVNGIAGALYIGSQFGPGPRDGLMTGLHARTGWSLRLIRTAIEVAVLVIGWLLGGTVGAGTVLYALAIGPIVQFFLPRCTVRLDHPPARRRPREPGDPDTGSTESTGSAGV